MTQLWLRISLVTLRTCTHYAEMLEEFRAVTLLQTQNGDKGASLQTAVHYAFLFI